VTTAAVSKRVLLHRLEDLRQIPTVPAVLGPLLRQLHKPIEQVDVNTITHLLEQDESLAAQCLHMANSPLFGRWQKVESLRAAVVSLGLHRVGDIAMSCSVLNLLPKGKAGMDPVFFWEHSLGCALVSRHLARQLTLGDPGKAYLAGLLHDLGIIVNLWVLPEEFRASFELAKAEAIPLHEAEQRTLGFTHCDSGRLLAERWGLAEDLTEVVTYHHAPENSTQHQELVAVVHIADLLCRMSGLNYGFVEERQLTLYEDAGFTFLAGNSSSLRHFDWARLTFELEAYLEEVHSLVRTIYRA
jgi:HD-like signal output (HDOD) protein